MREEVTSEDIMRVVEETSNTRVFTAQLKMLTELLVLLNEQGDIRTNLKRYIDHKEKEIGYE